MSDNKPMNIKLDEETKRLAHVSATIEEESENRVSSKSEISGQADWLIIAVAGLADEICYAIAKDFGQREFYTSARAIAQVILASAAAWSPDEPREEAYGRISNIYATLLEKWQKESEQMSEAKHVEQ